MRKIFILGGSDLQLDLILEAKKMFFYTIVLDMDKNCIGSKWCDEFLHIDIANKELVLQKAKEYNIEVILTSATELGNVTACFVGEKLGLNTNSYQTALNTTNKIFMKQILEQNDISTAKYKVFNADEQIDWDIFPCIIKPSDSSAGRGVKYCQNINDLQQNLQITKQFCKNSKIIVEQYIEGKQYSIETISCNGKHQIVAIDKEFIRNTPEPMEVAHQIPSGIEEKFGKKVQEVASKVLDAFDIKYGASHIEFRMDKDENIFIIELASRTGGMRSEMINLAYGISFSQLLLLSALNKLSNITISRNNRVNCNFIIDYDSYQTYTQHEKKSLIFEPVKIEQVDKDFKALNLIESKGFYYILEEK